MEMLLRSGLAQFPDRKLYNAAVLLTPEERPITTVEMVDDKQWYSKPGLQGSYIPIHPRLNPERPRVLIPRKAETYKQGDKKLHRLAAVLAHEGLHSRGFNEADAYQFQHDVLKRLGETDEELLRLMLERSQKERKKELAGSYR